MHGSVAYTPSLLVDSSSSSVVSTRRSGEAVPLLARPIERTRRKKPYYLAARPLWLVPFAFFSSIAQSMTLAPRIEIYTQLSCDHLYGNPGPSYIQHARAPSISSTVLMAGNLDHPSTPSFIHSDTITSHDSVPMVVPEVLGGTQPHGAMRMSTSRCASDPAVQASTTRMQMIITTTTGLFSALTSTWWGSFSDRYGRTKVLAISTSGLLLTDLIFILISLSSLPFSRHGYNLSIMAPIIEGLLGGFLSVQSATSSYVSDCTSPGSRAKIFSRFAGAFYIGSAIGPIIADFLIQHPIVAFGHRFPFSYGNVDTSVFWIAIAFSAVNFCMALFVFPESLGEKKRERAIQEYNKTGGISKSKAKKPLQSPIDGVVSEISRIEEQENEEARTADVTENTTSSTALKGFIMRSLSPLSILLPVVVVNPSGIVRKKRDWSLTLLAVGLFAYMLSTGILHVKYLYAIHTYHWSTRQLNHYISLIGGMRAFVLLLLLPTIIDVFKPKQPPIKDIASSKPFPTGKGKKATQNIIQPAPELTVMKGKKSKPNRFQLGREMSFDLALTKCSLMVDIISRSLITILPIPKITAQLKKSHHPRPVLPNSSSAQSHTTFVAASALSCLGAGLIPLIHSLALSLIELRALDAKISGIVVREDRTGELFGALAALQAVGQTILAPMLFGMIYSNTVAQFPKAIFIIGALLCLFALLMISGVRKQPVILKRRKVIPELERGRSRVSKDLRGGAIAYYPRSYSAVDVIKDGSENV